MYKVPDVARSGKSTLARTKGFATPSDLIKGCTVLGVSDTLDWYHNSLYWLNGLAQELHLDKNNKPLEIDKFAVLHDLDNYIVKQNTCYTPAHEDVRLYEKDVICKRIPDGLVKHWLGSLFLFYDPLKRDKNDNPFAITVAFHPQNLDVNMCPYTFRMQGFPNFVIGEGLGFLPQDFVINGISRGSVWHNPKALIKEKDSKTMPLSLKVKLTSLPFYMNRCFLDSITNVVLEAAGNATQGGIGADFYSALQTSIYSESVAFYVLSELSPDLFKFEDAIDGYLTGKLYPGDSIADIEDVCIADSRNYKFRSEPFYLWDEHYIYGFEAKQALQGAKEKPGTIIFYKGDENNGNPAYPSVSDKYMSKYLLSKDKKQPEKLQSYNDFTFASKRKVGDSDE